jgi:hypothetical protein
MSNQTQGCLNPATALPSDAELGELDVALQATAGVTVCMHAWLLTPLHSACLHPATGLPSDSDLGELDAALQATGVDVAPLQYVKTLKRNNLTGSAKASGGQGGGGGDGGALSALTSQAHLLDWADKTFGQGISQVTKSVKTLLGGACWACCGGLRDLRAVHAPRAGHQPSDC